MADFESLITQFFLTHAYAPWLVYTGIVAFMLASGFGLPLPEEIVLLGSGFICYMALNPDIYPPPSPDAAAVNPYVTAAVAFFAVMASDYLIFFLGQKLGPRILKFKFFARMMTPDRMNRVQTWVREYGYWTVILFRFTPGARFPGHLMCGAMGLSAWKFLAVDSIAASVSVPTQVLLMAFYGNEIKRYLTQFKIGIIAVFAIVLVIFVVRKVLLKRSASPSVL